MHRLSKSAVVISGVLGATSMAAVAQTTPAPTISIAPAITSAPAPGASTASVPCTGTPDPYANYNCLDAYLGDNPFTRFYRYYGLEMGQAGPPSDPNAPPSRVDGWPRTPQTTPPMPFTEWPYGGATAIGVTRSGSIDSPLMTAIANTGLGRWMNEYGFQVYGWIDPGFNFSSNSLRKPGGNAPVSYAYIPNTAQLDQVVLYLDRFPDTVQKDHIDWGLRLSAIYGENYRYTTSYGLASYQLLKYNAVNGYDFPMLYGEVYIPWVAQGLMLRAGRYISVPDIEAQLAPNNYTYTHSLTYTYDCYTQTGINATIKWSDHWTTQAGISGGCEASPWSPYAKVTGNLCVAYSWTEGRDSIYVCANSINDSKYSYNNLAAYYTTWYHKFGKTKWHTDWETWYQYMKQTPNVNNPAAASLLVVNSNGAQCKSASQVTCFAPEWATVNYVARQIGKDALIFRNEFFDDIVGQRTGFKTRYSEHGIAWNHWLGSTVVFRPEVRYEVAYDAPAYDSGLKRHQLMAAGDVIWFF